MPIWKLSPINLDVPNWEASIFNPHSPDRIVEGCIGAMILI